MEHISRPVQIALVAVVLLAGVWLFALRGHSTSSTEPTASSPTAAGSSPGQTARSSAHSSGASSAASAAGGPSAVYHGPVPGLTGLSRAIARAHGAVALSQSNAAQLEQKSSQASSATSPPAESSTTAPTVSRTAPGTAPRVAAPSTSSSSATGSASIKSVTGIPKRQRAVEADLKAGTVVAILFWDPSGSDDVLVRRELQVVERSHEHAHAVTQSPSRRTRTAAPTQLTGKMAVFEARASEVASFGAITRGVQVYGTPTILIIGERGHVDVVTGLTDSYAIEQAVDEVAPS